MATLIEKSLRSLQPKGEIAWKGLTDGVQRQISDGLAVQAERDRQNGKDIVKNFYPSTTNLQQEWEQTYRLPSGSVLTTEQRKMRLESVWSRTQPASFDGMNEIYADNGLDLIARPLLPGEDPREIATSDEELKVYTTVTGLNMRCGLNARCGSFDIIPGTAETKIFADGRPGTPVKNYTSVCGNMRCGLLSSSSRCGNFEGSRLIPPDITIPDDIWTWALIYIIEGKDGEFAKIPMELKEIFEFVTYKNKPQFMWGISRVEYV